jgi:hypothetical protein
LVFSLLPRWQGLRGSQKYTFTLVAIVKFSWSAISLRRSQVKERRSSSARSYFSKKEAYDPKTDRLTTLSPMPHGRHGFGGDVISNDAYFVGGSLTPGDAGATDQLLLFRLP